jgi:hypothetical protein
MALQKNLPHLVVNVHVKPERFASKMRGGSGDEPSVVRNRAAHASALIKQLKTVQRASVQAASREDLPAKDRGVYVTVESRKSEPLLTDRLERNVIELLAVKPGEVTSAVVFMPVSAKDEFDKLVEQYRTKINPQSKSNAPMNRPFIDGIASFKVAGVKDLWTDRAEVFPKPGTPFSWEVWLRPNSAERFRSAARSLKLSVGAGGLSFPETTVVRVQATPAQMSKLVHLTNCVAALKRASVTAEFFDELKPVDQAAFAKELLARATFTNAEDAPRVCVLDTGVNRGHLLLTKAIAETDCNSVDGNWTSDDHHGHGTELAGIALYGDLQAALDSSDSIEIGHRLESVKIIPPKGENAYDLLGVITRDAVNIAELFGGVAARAFCLASTTVDDAGHFGRPTSWAAELDQLAAGVGEKQNERRLILVSAGNVREPGNKLPKADTYPLRNDTAEIEAPAQAWNAVTVGGYTEKGVLTAPSLKGYVPLAPNGDLAPSSRTASWDGEWPIKPDVVLEAGNLAVEPGTGLCLTTADLSVLTTCKDSPNPVFSHTDATSAATAAGARLAALIWQQYPDLWPETVRGLIALSAAWTPAMLSHLPPKANKGDYQGLLRRYGHGVPDQARALHSASNVLTLVVQDEIQPYAWEKNKTRLNEMKLFPLPWPEAALLALGTEEVRLRIALSYFVAPNPSEAQRERKLRYASHGLRFRLRLPDEDDQEFRKRINKAALQAGEKVSAKDSEGWTLGAGNREVGSLHCDTWTGSASDLARRSSIAVFPVGGWWKERGHLGQWANKGRFALVATIDAGENDVDIYTPVVTQVEAAIASATTIET